MKKLLLLVILLSLAVYLWKPVPKTPAPQDTQVAASPMTIGRKVISYEGVEGKTALELLKSSHETVTKTSSYGEYVESIDGIVGGVEGRYWIVYVDGAMSSIGAAELQTKNGQKIEWKFETEAENGTP
jgi:hypothetical protein